MVKPNQLNMQKTLLKFLAIALSSAILACTGNLENNQEFEEVINFSNFDSTVNPTDDFYRFVNGKWLDQAEIPADKSAWGTVYQLYDENQETTMRVIEEAVQEGDYQEGSDQWKAIRFYELAMDSSRAQKLGAEPLTPYLDQIEAITSLDDLLDYVVLQHQYGDGGFFDFGVGPDLKNSLVNVINITQGGMGLPEKDYYLGDTERFKDIRSKYLEHLAGMLGLIGYQDDEAKAAAANIFDLEKKLAANSMSRLERRNIPALHNVYTLTSWQNELPDFNWDGYFSGLGLQNVDSLVVQQPAFMNEFTKLWNETPIDTWKDYAKWHLINRASPYLSNEFVEADFNFYNTNLYGQEQNRPRKQRMLGLTNRYLGEAIGKIYVESVFPPEAKKTAIGMVENLVRTYKNRIDRLEWMSDSTKLLARQKLEKMKIKVGYPDQWKDYSSMKLQFGEDASLYENVRIGALFEFKDNLGRYGKEVDRDEWFMPPQTLNAYYNPQFNEIVFPAAILQPPLFNHNADMAVNYGGIGTVIGHEISHGFDDSGSRFDAEGNMVNWWSDQDLANFKELSKTLVTQFSAYQPLEDTKVDGELTLGENIGDLGGVESAFEALQLHLEENGHPGEINGLTPEERFFINYASVWKILYRDELMHTLLTTDTHSPNEYRTNGPLSNMVEFYDTFGVTATDGMYRPDSIRVEIW